MAIDPLTGAMLASAGSNLLGGLLGGRDAKKAARAQADAAARVAALYNNLELPSVEDMSIQSEQGQIVGEYNPLLEQLLSLQPSAMEGIDVSPEYKDLQLQALRKMAGVGEDGLDEGDEAAFRQMQRKIAGEAQAQQAAILNNMAQRGTLGSGMELAARLQGSQAAMDRLSSSGDQLTQDARSRALQALSQTGSMAGSLRGQDFEEQERIARAKDAINQFNVQNQQQLQGRNISEQNRAQLANLQARQAMANANMQLRNQDQMFNKGLLQQDYQNRLQKLGGQTGAQTQIGNAQAGMHGANAQMWSGIGSSLGNVATAFGSAAQANANAAANRESAERAALFSYGNQNPQYTRALQKYDPNQG